MADSEGITEVAIVGGGPVGLGLAIDLTLRGIKVVVLEKSRDIHQIPKGQNLTQRSAEHFMSWGVADAMEEARRIPAEFGTAGVTTYGNLLSDYQYRWLARSDVREFYAARNLRIPQYDAERVLRARAGELGIDLRLGTTVTALEQNPDGVTLTAEDDSGTASSVKARFAVGCDGSRSLVREAAGIDQSFGPHRNRMVLSVFRSQELHDLLERFPGVSYYNAMHADYGGFWQFMGRVDLENTYFFHCPVPEDTTEETVDLAGCLTKAVGQPIAFETVYVGFWNLRVAIADTYRAGSVFIAGDAAHSHPPYGGYGVNSGFEDARNLAWKLEASLKGWAGHGLLDSYSAERQPVFKSTARDFIEYMIDDDAEFLSKYDPERDRATFEQAWAKRSQEGNAGVSGFVPHYAASPIVIGGEGDTSALGEHRHTAEAGYHLSPQGGVYERLGAHFTLLLVGAEADIGQAFKDAADRAGVPLDVVIMDSSDDTGRWEAACILVRPDHFVAYAGSPSAQDAESILTAAVGG